MFQKKITVIKPIFWLHIGFHSWHHANRYNICVLRNKGNLVHSKREKITQRRRRTRRKCCYKHTSTTHALVLRMSMNPWRAYGVKNVKILIYMWGNFHHWHTSYTRICMHRHFDNRELFAGFLERESTQKISLNFHTKYAST